MRLTRFSMLGCLISAVLAGSNCENGNNCQRALLRTSLPSRNPLLDCNSYFRVTVTPATSTITYTALTTTTATVNGVPQKRREILEARQVTASASKIPAYASPCSGAVQYSSACSCIGAIRSTVTVAAPLTSTTTSSTVTSTTTTGVTGNVPFGDAMAYQETFAGVQRSFTLDLQSGQGCNRFGWYMTPTLAELQGSINGALYVLDGGNTINVGTWVAIANFGGGVTVTYLVSPPYSLTELHIDLDCLPIDNCNPAQYTYGSATLPYLVASSNPTPLAYPTCSGGSVAYLVVNAKIARLQSL